MGGFWEFNEVSLKAKASAYPKLHLPLNLFPWKLESTPWLPRIIDVSMEEMESDKKFAQTRQGPVNPGDR